MKISTKFSGLTSTSYKVIGKGVRKTPQKRKKREIPCQSDIPMCSCRGPLYVLAKVNAFQRKNSYWVGESEVSTQ